LASISWGMATQRGPQWPSSPDSKPQLHERGLLGVAAGAGGTVTTTTERSSRAFAAGLTGLGVLNLIYADFALQWQPVPGWVPGRTGLAYLCGILMVGGGIGCLLPGAAPVARRVIFWFVLLWLVLLNLPRAVAAPAVQINWTACGEIAVLLAAAWLLTAPERSMRHAQLLFGIALLPIGLSHFVYAKETANLVPAWLPARTSWAILGGAGHLAAGLGVSFGVLARLAATLEAGMIAAFTLLVWIPAVLMAPSRLTWTALLVSWTIAAGAWVVAESYRGGPWLATSGAKSLIGSYR
jgi:uncharacterized membrane protein